MKTSRPIRENLLELVGNTPLIEIRSMNPNPRVRILAKAEYLNPGGSIKDRAALFMIEEGEKSGELTPDKTVLEATSGNTGIGLAMVCAIKGYRLLLTMSEAASEERKKILLARGAEIRLTPGHMGTDGAIEEVYRLAREEPDRYFMTDQFNNPANWLAHYETTGPEILADAGADLACVVATMGTTGTLMGLSRRIKEERPDVRIIGVEPYLGHKIQGLKNMKEAYVPEIFEKDRLDEKVNIEDGLAYETARRLAREEGLFVGMSSGAAMAVALDAAEKMDSGTVVAILPDGGERYLSTALFTVRRKVDIACYNTASRKEEPFVPREESRVSMFVNGPTASGPLGLTEARRLVFADLLHRYLAFRGLDVNRVLHVTDMDDRTIEQSAAENMEHGAFTEKNLKGILADLGTLGVAPATTVARTTEHAQDMVALAEKLVEKGVAYEKLRSLYFDISRLEGYGELSGVDLDKIRVGATVDLDEYEKDNPRDFTLFKRTRLTELKRGIFMKTPWGNVRPSWHLQCAAMALKYLGENFDLHVSSKDLVFPHHENETAIAKAATGKPLARFWLDCDLVFSEGKKAGTGTRVPELLAEGWTGAEIRYWFLTTHYRKPVTQSGAQLENARKSLARLNRFVETLANVRGEGGAPETDQIVYDIQQGFSSAMDADFSVPAALAALFTSVKSVNKLLGQGRLGQADAKKILDALKKVNTVLNVLTFPQARENPDAEKLLAQREQARARGDYKTADVLREKLEQMGVTVRDAKPGKR